MSDGLTILVQRALIKHDMVAVSQIFSKIYFTALGQLLELSSERAEKIASKMILGGSLKASIDQLDGALCSLFRTRNLHLLLFCGMEQVRAFVHS